MGDQKSFTEGKAKSAYSLQAGLELTAIFESEGIAEHSNATRLLGRVALCIKKFACEVDTSKTVYKAVIRSSRN